MQDDGTVSVPLKYLILVPDIQEANVLNLQFKVCPSPPLGAPRLGRGVEGGELNKPWSSKELQKVKLQYKRMDTNFQ